MSETINKEENRRVRLKGRADLSSAYACIADWACISGMGRSATYEAIGAGYLVARKLGSSTLIDVQHGLAWLNSLPQANIRRHHKRSQSTSV